MYEPKQTPHTIDDLALYIAEELREISNAFYEMEIDHARMKTHHLEPDKPRAGDIYRADGSDWNPGSGAGLYEYSGAAWVKL